MTVAGFGPDPSLTWEQEWARSRKTFGDIKNGEARGDWLQLSTYDAPNFHLPYGPEWDATRIQKLPFQQDILLNSQLKVEPKGELDLLLEAMHSLSVRRARANADKPLSVSRTNNSKVCTGDVAIALGAYVDKKGPDAPPARAELSIRKRR